MKALFVRPPRYSWPFNSESSSFWQPLGFISMAATLRDSGFKVEVLDCLPLRMGWASLKRRVASLDFDVLCVGDETASANESIRLVAHVKDTKPGVTTVGGGFFFSFMEARALGDWRFDYVVRGEGEQALLELLCFLDGRSDAPDFIQTSAEGSRVAVRGLAHIGGLAFMDEEGALSVNDPRGPVDLDRLPLPAYDLLPMQLYGHKSSNHPDFAAIEHGRGCTGGCRFCSIYALFKCKGASPYRTKSAQRSFEETRILVERYGRKTLNWTDGTFNLDPRWSEEYFGLLAEHGITVKHTAWMRADFAHRDQERGVLQKMIAGGLVQAVVGLERLSDGELEDVHKNQSLAVAEAGFRTLMTYPTLLVIGTLIYGLPDDDRASLDRLWAMQRSDLADFFFLIPFTPYPGTEWWDRYKDSLGTEDFGRFNMHMPITGTRHLSREEIERWLSMVFLKSALSPGLLFKRMLVERNPRKRKVMSSLTKKALGAMALKLRNRLRPTEGLLSVYGRKPDWYDS